MPKKQRERRLQPAPSDKSSSSWKTSSNTDKSEDQDYLPQFGGSRFGFREFPEHIHKRARERRIENRHRGIESVKRPLIDLDGDGKHTCDYVCLRLSDADWFATHPIARSRVRCVMAGENDLAAATRVLVTLKGHRTIVKSYIGGGTA